MCVGHNMTRAVVRLAIGVLSGPGSRFEQRRNELRQGFLGEAWSTFAYRFVVRCGGMNTSMRDHVMRPDVYCATADHREPRVRGAIYALVDWFSFALWAFPSALCIGKIDDDSFLNIPLCLQILRMLPEHQLWYAGAMYRWNYDLKRERLWGWGGMDCDTCVGPFTFATGSLMLLSVPLCRSFVRRSHSHLSVVRKWSDTHAVVYEDAWLGMQLRADGNNLTYYKLNTLLMDEDGFRVPTTLLSYHNRYKLGCRVFEMSAYYERVRRMSCTTHLHFTGTKARATSTCPGVVDLRNSAMRNKYSIPPCPVQS